MVLHPAVARLLRGMATGDSDLRRWFVEDVMPLEPVLRHFLKRSWKNSAEIPDLLQEVYVRAYEAAAREQPRAVKPFLLTIARNLVIDRLRHMNAAPVEVAADFEELNVIDSSPSPENQVSAREELRQLEKALDDLPARSRQIVMWRRIDNLSQREVAQKLGVTEEVVESQVARAMRQLAAAIRGRREQVFASARRSAALRRSKSK